MSNTFLKSLSKKELIIYSVLFLVCFLVFMWNNSYSSVWFDEIFTLAIIKLSFSDIITVTANDVHPPLYYFMVKIYCFIFGDTIPVIRFFSLIPILIIVVLSTSILRKIFDNKITVIFILLTIFMPVMLYIVSDIRMYSWCMLWVFLASFYAYKLFYNINSLNVILYALFTNAAAYTHNYGLLSVFFLYSVLLLFVFFKRRKKFFTFIAIGILIALLYLPWFIQLLNQMIAVKRGYWIPPIELSQIIEYIYSPFDFNYPELNVPQWIITFKPFALIVITSLCLIILIKAQFNEDKIKIRLANLFLFLYFLPGCLGILYSFLIKPIFISRYLICGFTFFLLSYAIYLSKLKMKNKFDKLIIILFSVSLISISAVNFYLNREWAKERDSIQVRYTDYIKANSDDNIAFLYTESNSPSLAIYTTLFPKSKHFALVDPSSSQNPYFIKCFPYTRINNISDIDTAYTSIVCVESYGWKDNIMYNKDISVDILKLFQIKNNIVAGNKEYNLYLLERKK